MEDEQREIEKWCRFNGSVGNPPPWYFLIQQARYLGVAPWELEERPEWADRAKTAELAELRAGLRSQGRLSESD